MADTAILLMNLGSPAQPDTKHLKPYLTQFLMDERVIDLPKLLRTVLVRGFIVPLRAPKSAAKYKTVWTAEGSPLVVHTKNQVALLQEKTDAPVYFSMRYGQPSTKNVLAKIHSDNPDLKELSVLPLYPHYAMSSYETAVAEVEKEHRAGKFQFLLDIVPAFYDHPLYIKALTESIEPYLSQPFDHLLFSYHGIPERHVRKTGCEEKFLNDVSQCCPTMSASSTCYRHQVFKTTQLVSEQLGLQKSQYSVSFQSRLGMDAWLKPFTVEQLKAFPAQGIKKLLVVCPAFVSDCLETLEEIQEEGREDFLKSGGETFTMIPAMNESALWIDCMYSLLNPELTRIDKAVIAM